jgi:PAS domain S-box-containing protein
MRPMFTDEKDLGDGLDPSLVGDPDALIVIDDLGDVVELNAAAEAMFGVDRLAVIRRPVSELVSFGRPVGWPLTGIVQRTARWAVWVRDWSAEQPAADASRQRETMFAQAEELGQIGSWDWNAATGDLRWSDNCYRLFGLEPNQLPPTIESVLSRIHPDDVDRVAGNLDRAAATGILAPFDYRVVVGDGEIRHLRVALAAATDGEPNRFIGFVQDVTERRRMTREITAHIAVAEALAHWQSFRTGAEGLLCRLGEAMEFERGLLWVPLDGVLVPRAAWHQNPAVDLLSQLGDMRLAPGIGIAGRAWSTRSPVNLPNAHDRQGYAFRSEAIREGVRGGLAIPAVHDEEVLAVLSFGSKEEVALTERLLQTITGIGHELGLFLIRHRAEFQPPRLSARELDVLKLAADGLTVNALAQQLVIEPSTVKTHLTHIYRKLGASDRAAAVAQALRQGLID